MPVYSQRHRLPAIITALLLILVVIVTAQTVRPADADLRLSLDEAIQLALQKNYDIRIEALNVPIARAQVTEALGRFDLTLEGSYETAREKVPNLRDPISGVRPAADLDKTMSARASVGGTTPFGTEYSVGGSTTDTRDSTAGLPDLYSTFAGISVTQPLLRDFGFSSGLVEVRLARTNLALSEWDYRRAVINTITDVIYAYNDLVLAETRYRAAQRSRELAVQLFTANERRRELGSMSEYDVLSARAKAANREEAVIYWALAVRIAENAVKQLITDDRNPTLLALRITTTPLNAVAGAISVDPANDFNSALELRPDYRGAQLAVKRGDLNYRYERNQLLPRVDVSASYGYGGVGTDFASSRADARSREFASYSAGVSVSVPLTFSRERGRVRAARLSKRQAETELQKLEQDILIAVGNAAMRLENTQRRVESTRSARELNEQVLQAELKKLRAGTGSTFNVLYQQDQLASAEMYEAQAQCDLRKAIAEYDRQLGRTLITHHVSLKAD